MVQVKPKRKVEASKPEGAVVVKKSNEEERLSFAKKPEGKAKPSKAEKPKKVEKTKKWKNALDLIKEKEPEPEKERDLEDMLEKGEIGAGGRLIPVDTKERDQTHRFRSEEWKQLREAAVHGDEQKVAVYMRSVKLEGRDVDEAYHAKHKCPESWYLHWYYWTDYFCLLDSLLSAIDQNNHVMLRILLSRGFSYGSFRTDDNDLLLRAMRLHSISRNYHTMISMLLRHRSLVNHHKKLFELAMEMNDVQLFRILIEDHANNYGGHDSLLRSIGSHPYFVHPNNFSLLHVCAERGLDAFVEMLLTKSTTDFPYLHVDNCVQTQGDSRELRSHSTSLHVAAQNGRTSTVKLLIKHGADPLIQDVDGRTAAERASSQAIKDLLKQAAEQYRQRYVRQNTWSGVSESVNIKQKATLRLLRDIREMYINPLDNVRAIPLETDIFQWHVVLSAPPRANAAERNLYPYAGIRFHLVLQFPLDYPRSPPKITVSHYLPHPNVFERYLCLDMLQIPYYGAVDPETGQRRQFHAGWTCAYTVQSILVQLQSFLFDLRVPQYGEVIKHTSISAEDRQYMVAFAERYKCRECGFNYTFKAVNFQRVNDLDLAPVYKGWHNKFKAPQVNKPVTTSDSMRRKKKAHESKSEHQLNDSRKVDSVNLYMVDKAPVKHEQNPEITEELKRLRESSARSLRGIPVPHPSDDRCVILDLPGWTLMEIVDRLPRIEDVSALMRTCKQMRNVIDEFNVWTRRELLCFFSRRNMTEEVLGIGLYVERHKNTDKLKTLWSPLDLISRSAFLEDELRRSAYGENFNYWLPLPLTTAHARYSLPLAKSMLVAIHRNISFVPKDRVSKLEREYGPTAKELFEFDEKMDQLAKQFNPLIVLDIIPKLMNHMVVALMKQDSKGKLPLHASEKALLGYCSYHHILLNLALEYPQIQDHVDYYLDEFMAHPSRRVKLVVPDLGELLVRLCISRKYSWKDVAEPFLQEFFDRTVFWTLDERQHNMPELAYLEQDAVSEYRLDRTLRSTQTATRLLMFQVFFMRFVGKPQGKSLPQILDLYNKSYGRPQRGTAETLCDETKRIHHVDSWSEFYRRIGLAEPSLAQMSEMLRQSVRNSESKGYHVCRIPEATLLQWRLKRDMSMNSIRDVTLPTLADAISGNVKKLETVADMQPKKQNAVELAAQRGNNTNPTKVIVKNLPFRLSDEEFAFLFQQFGNIVSAQVARDPQTNRSRGFGFVVFGDAETAKTVIDHTSGLDVNGRPVTIELAGQSERRKKEQQERERHEQEYHKRQERAQRQDGESEQIGKPLSREKYLAGGYREYVPKRK